LAAGAELAGVGDVVVAELRGSGGVAAVAELAGSGGVVAIGSVSGETLAAKRERPPSHAKRVK
jgi:hypothetical protein